MKLDWLVVSDPPHDDVDIEKASEILGLTQAEAGMKTSFAAPEVWLALGDELEADQAVSALRSAGLSVRALEARALLGPPGPAPAASFMFCEEAFVARYDDGEVWLPYDVPVLGVFCRPPSGFRPEPSRPSKSIHGRSSTLVFIETRGERARELQATEAMELMTVLDLYAFLESGVRRVSIVQDAVSFSGLGALLQPSGVVNMATTIEECRRRISQFTLDARLADVRPRQRPSVGCCRTDTDGRRLYSFGTIGLGRILESASPELANLTQHEFGSRLAYLIYQGHRVLAPSC